MVLELYQGKAAIKKCRNKGVPPEKTLIQRVNGRDHGVGKGEIKELRSNA